jgi:hypothetical protein
MIIFKKLSSFVSIMGTKDVNIEKITIQAIKEMPIKQIEEELNRKKFSKNEELYIDFLEDKDIFKALGIDDANPSKEAELRIAYLAMKVVYGEITVSDLFKELYPKDSL